MRRAELEDALHGAGERGELLLFYQPEVQLRTNKIVACEALEHAIETARGCPVVELGSVVEVRETDSNVLETDG